MGAYVFCGGIITLLPRPAFIPQVIGTLTAAVVLASYYIGEEWGSVWCWGASCLCVVYLFEPMLFQRYRVLDPMALANNETAEKVRAHSVWKSAWAHLEQSSMTWSDRTVWQDNSEEGACFHFQVGDTVQVTGSADAMWRACRSAGISEDNDRMRRNVLGLSVRILKLDEDGTAKVVAKDIGEVWLGVRALSFAV